MRDSKQTYEEMERRVKVQQEADAAWWKEQLVDMQDNCAQLARILAGDTDKVSRHMMVINDALHVARKHVAHLLATSPEGSSENGIRLASWAERICKIQIEVSARWEEIFDLRQEIANRQAHCKK